ncbi:phosphatase [Lithospermum erythrorhizon]|uniref:Phosphatase n=1 Tax=Lithospermum erythrorhizon TaxID=34254 RepID=A0AAV3R642_LITER
MSSLHSTLATLITTTLLLTSSASPSLLRILHRKIPNDEYLYCESWRFVVETNDAAPWTRVPEKCTAFVKEYVSGQRYSSDLEAVVEQSLAFAKTVEVSADGKDVWVFDIDETLLSNVPWYAHHGFGSVKNN